jgi:hypothetical protein
MPRSGRRALVSIETVPDMLHADLIVDEDDNSG